MFQQGEIWLTRLDPTEGSEIRKTRPCVIISRSLINHKLNTVTIIPLSTGKNYRTLLQIDVLATKHNGLKKDSHLEIPQIRAISKSRLIKKLGLLEAIVFDKIQDSFEAYFWEEN
jgi:mRNA interferase MazF